MFTSGQIIAVAFLDILGVSLNVWFLYTVKTRQSPYNAIDILQGLKTIFVILALVSSVWLDLVTCSHSGNDTVILVCVASKAVVENTLFHSVCFTFLSVACVRRKVCKCRGRAAVLITMKYAIKTLILILTPLCMFTAATISLVTNYGNYRENIYYMGNLTSGITETRPKPDNVNDIIISDYSKVIYQLCHTIILNILPLVISFVIYVNIIRIVRKTAQNSEGYISQRNNHPTKLITISIVVLLACTSILWGIYAVTKIVSMYFDINTSVFIYLKLTILIVHPFGEGLLQPSTRKQGDRIHRRLNERSTRQVHPDTSPSMTSIQDEMGSRQLAEYLPTLIEEKESGRIRDSSETDRFDTSAGTKLSKAAQKKRRESIFYPRPSVLMKNAPLIGLEYRDEPSIISLTHRRRDSEERLRKGLQQIEEDQFSNASCRRLSTCMRLSTTDSYTHDFIYEDYRKMYSPESVKYSNQNSPVPGCNAQGYKGLSYAQNSRGSNVQICHSPSRKRWKKLFTTARTARHLSKPKSHYQSEISESETTPKHIIISKANERQRLRKLSSFESVKKFDMSGVQEPNKLYDESRDLQKQTRRKDSYSSNKKRSASTITNDFVEDGNTRQQTRERNKSVSFISNIVLDGHPDSSHSSNTFPRSISCDAKISVNYRKDIKEKIAKPQRRSDDVYVRASRAERGAGWTVNSSTTKEECIKQLLQWKDYF